MFTENTVRSDMKLETIHTEIVDAYDMTFTNRLIDLVHVLFEKKN